MERLDIAAEPPRENGDAMFGRHAFDIVARRDEIVEDRAVGGEPLGVAGRDLLQMIEGEAGQHFRLVRLV